jgi:competence protein ComEC
VISAGYQNPFGHPRKVVLDRLQIYRVKTYRTDLQGAVTFLLDGKRVEARVQPH